MTRSIRVALAAGALAFLAVPLGAQQDPRLVGAVRLAQDGHPDSARAVVARILALTQPGDSLYPEVIFTVGLLAATPQDRRLYLRRVVVEHPQSPWADDALLQVAQLDFAGGDSEGTVRQVSQLLTDYPGSPLTATAALWGARAAGNRRDTQTACRMADAGLAAVGTDVELRNQLEFQKNRCQSLAGIVAESAAAAARDSARADSMARARSTSRPGPARSGYYVQVSAVQTQSALNVELDRVRRAGFTPVTVREGGFLKVRAGPFRTRGEAETAAAQIRAKLAGRPFVLRVP